MGRVCGIHSGCSLTSWATIGAPRLHVIATVLPLTLAFEGLGIWVW